MTKHQNDKLGVIVGLDRASISPPPLIAFHPNEDSTASTTSTLNTQGRKYALITGVGKGGIGDALAHEMRHQGYEVFGTLLPHESREHLISSGIHAFNADVTSDEDTVRLMKALEPLCEGRLDVLVNNAGICYTMPATDTQVSEVEKMFKVNVFGPMRMVHFFHPWLVAAKGVVVNIGSVGGICPYIYGASYNASKAALHHYGNTLRAELKPFGVRVMTVISGEIQTNILRHDRTRMLPKDSLFAPLKAAFSNHVGRTPNTMTPQIYAKAVVQEAMKQKPKAWFWYGPTTSLVWRMETFLPKDAWDSMLWKWFNFDALVPKAGK
ncbi:NADPH-dependent 1-acyldihydroxyacetone phosphate reductase [Cytospora mali]|uniref:NADPH-dependent 1-acyldihydroxyacetone phosphate reductase n=1 Tax=Cytospora mali TaxID=578113 RepID=A0A194VD50_CYTMA|nr:NADPH-dependent 1-acyldihydroxyacetone phosphate reductase [Valsa mali var. pyri (nom. inval.)]